MRQLTTLIGLFAVVSCAEVNDDAMEHATSSETREESKEPMCDGSAELRFVYQTAGGGQTLTPYYFTEPHGHEFFAIDGKCRYYVERDYMRGVMSGTLTSEDAEQLSTDMHWNELDAWVDLKAQGGCFDASTSTLTKPHAAVGCFCGCESEPMALVEAMTNTTQWMEKLLSEGEPLDGPVSAAIDLASHGGPIEQPVFDWPLERAIDSIADLLLQAADPRLVSGSDQWARFDDEAEYKQLRELRAKALKAKDEHSWFSPAILLKKEEKALSDLYVRDELPDGFEQAWKDLHAGAMQTK